MGNWKAVKNAPCLGTDGWQLFKLTGDVGENHDLAKEHPDLAKTCIDLRRICKGCWDRYPSVWKREYC
jgi:arylsulfatase A-like enzyme